MTITPIKIVSDGTAFGTKVYADGVELTGIAEIVIDPIQPNSIVGATVRFCQVELDLVAEARQ